MGLGLNSQGSGVSAAKFFASSGAKVTVTDLKTEKELAPSIKLLKNFPMKFVLGKHNKEDFTNVDLIIKNPGVRQDSPHLQIAKKNGVKIESDVSIFWKLCPAPIIGITGTRGKSTTTALIGEMLKKGNPPQPPFIKGGRGGIFVGGNIQISPLNFIDKIKPNSKVVLELSSWMLEDLFIPTFSSCPDAPFGIERVVRPRRTRLGRGGGYFSPYPDEVGIGGVRGGPRIAVLTNLMPDHLNTYKSFKVYIKTKALIFQNQTKKDFAVLNYDDKEVEKLSKNIKAKKIWFSSHSIIPRFNRGIHRISVKNKEIYFDKEKIASLKEVALLGKHNISNILAAVAVAKLEGVSNQSIAKVLKSFKGLPNRLEFVREVRGIKFYNDTTATMPEATMCALRALSQIRNPKSEIRNIILIAGGADKKLDYKKLGQEIKKYCKAVILFKGEASKKIARQLSVVSRKLLVLKDALTMKGAVKNAVELAKKGDIILLSPSAASFGLFQNEFDRGEQFVKKIKKL